MFCSLSSVLADVFLSSIPDWMQGTTLRYMGDIWLIFQVLQLQPNRFTQQNSCCISKPAMKHLQKPDWKSDLPKFSYGYHKCVFVDFLAGDMGLPIVFTFECRDVINIWRCSPISPKHVSLWGLLFDPCRTTYQPNIHVKLRKRATSDPSTLSLTFIINVILLPSKGVHALVISKRPVQPLLANI
jgi:hypothetical protein